MNTEPPRQGPERRTSRAQSLVIVNTGDGKGKTTAAMGVALRSLARGWRVCAVQFVKSDRWRSGEVRVLRELGAEWHAMGDGFTWDSDDLERSAEIARDAWQLAAQQISSGEFQLVVLDEVTYPINWGWIDADEVVATIKGRPLSVNVIITGREAPSRLVEIADTVSEIHNVKHAFDAGIAAMRGIDF